MILLFSPEKNQKTDEPHLLIAPFPSAWVLFPSPVKTLGGGQLAAPASASRSGLAHKHEGLGPQEGREHQPEEPKKVDRQAESPA
jgi:hypothetical protein